MDAAHFHLVVNHLPLVGVMVGTLVLVAGYIFRKPDIRLTGLGIYIFSALGAALAFLSGEGAEEIVEDLAGVSETLMHRHEEWAETFFILMLVLGGIALLGLFAGIKKLRFAPFLMVFTLILGLAAGGLSTVVGTSGGEIRHSEIRTAHKVFRLETEDDD